MCVMAGRVGGDEVGDVSQREKMARDLYTSAVLFAFWYKPWWDQVRDLFSLPYISTRSPFRELFCDHHLR